ncbi:MAG: CCA tRNA nucleotidyltransferase, partial [Nitrosopumilus sp.]|nr:CCA tRNA nucleotidyltransferase [Nitrosopumilus sp.]
IDHQNEIYLFFFLESTKISRIYSKNGPEFFREDSSKSFISKNIQNSKLLWVGNNKKIIALGKRKHTEVTKFIAEFLKKNFQVGIPQGLQNDFKRGFNVSIGSKNLSKSIKEAASELISIDDTLLYFN